MYIASEHNDFSQLVPEIALQDHTFPFLVLPISETCSEADLLHRGQGKRYTSTSLMPPNLALAIVALALLSLKPDKNK